MGFEILSVLLGGGATGFLGSVVSQFGDYKRAQLTSKHELEKLRQEGINLEKELAANMQIVELEAESKESIEEIDAFERSFENDRARYYDAALLKGSGKFGEVIRNISGLMLAIVDIIRGLLRPVLTVYFAVLLSIISLELIDLVGGVEYMGTAAAEELLTSTIYMIEYLAATTVGWWFGTRAKQVIKHA